MVGRWRALSWEGWLSIAVAVVIIVFAVTVPGFLSPSSAISISRLFAFLGILAVGQSLVMAAGGIDLSVGSIYGFAGATLAILNYSGYGFGVTLFAGLGVGIAFGLINGLLVTKLRFMPFIATFGMMGVIRALSILIREGTIGLGAHAVADTPWTYLAREDTPLWLPPSFFILIGLAVGAWWLLNRTRFGLWAYATGGNLNAARAVGVPIDKVRILTYVIAGALAAMTGMLSVGSAEGVRTWDGAGMELRSLAAVIIGGASLAGGSASIVGTLLAVLLFSVVKFGVSTMGLALYFQQIITALMVLLALILTRLSLRGDIAGRKALKG